MASSAAARLICGSVAVPYPMIRPFIVGLPAK
jgi:hypothetical protein